MDNVKDLTFKETIFIIDVLKKRFINNQHIHPEIIWDDVLKALEFHDDKLWPLYQMEISGGEPALITYDKDKGEYLFFDTVKESPKERRSLCYDNAALLSRKKNRPEGSVLDACKIMKVELLSEADYRYLQSKVKVDEKTSSWIKTPEKIRSLNGALFCDRRYETVFVYHNSAESYYSSRGFRCLLRV